MHYYNIRPLTGYRAAYINHNSEIHYSTWLFLATTEAESGKVHDVIVDLHPDGFFVEPTRYKNFLCFTDMVKAVSEDEITEQIDFREGKIRTENKD